MSEQNAFVGTDAAAAKLQELRSRPGMADQVAKIRAEMEMLNRTDQPT